MVRSFVTLARVLVAIVALAYESPPPLATATGAPQPKNPPRWLSTTGSGAPYGDTPTVGRMCPQGLEVSKISGQDEHAVAASLVIGNGNYNGVHGGGCSPAGR